MLVNISSSHTCLTNFKSNLKSVPPGCPLVREKSGNFEQWSGNKTKSCTVRDFTVFLWFIQKKLNKTEIYGTFQVIIIGNPVILMHVSILVITCSLAIFRENPMYPVTLAMLPCKNCDILVYLCHY